MSNENWTDPTGLGLKRGDTLRKLIERIDAAAYAKWARPNPPPSSPPQPPPPATS